MTPQEFMQTYENHSTNHQLEATLNLIDDDAVYFFSNESAHWGKEAIKNAIKANFKTIKNESFSLKNLTYLVNDRETAVILFNYHWTGEIDNKDVIGSGRGTSVLRRNGTSWKVIHEHLSHGPLKEEE